MRRKLALSGFILGISITALTILLMIMGGVLLVGIFAGVGSGEGVGVFTIIIALEVLFFALILVLNAVSISSTSSATKFHKRKGLTITTIVFNFIAMLSCVLLVILGGISSVWAILFLIVVTLGLVTANILIVIDLARNDKALKSEEEIKS